MGNEIGNFGKERILRLERLTNSSEQGACEVCGRTRSVIRLAALVATAGLLAGCDTKQWFTPTEMVRGGNPKESLVVPILTAIDPVVENGPGDYATAKDPTADDRVTSSVDYTIGRGDLLNITISELQGIGQETQKVSRVSESGNISLPYLGAVHAEGKTEIELEKMIVDAYREANLIQNAQVSVTVVEARGRAFEILGAVQAPGQYAILDSNFRLLNALVLGKDVNTPLIEYIYVIREGESQHSPGTTRQPMVPMQPSGPMTPPTSKPAKAPDDLSPGADLGTPGPAVAAGSARPLALLADTPSDLSPAAATAPTTAAVLPVPALPATRPAGSGSFEFNPPDDQASVRVIKIPYGALRAGDLNYNIAIRPRDIIVVQSLPVGEYYMGGHIARPGAFTLSGRRITLKQAVISAGMFDELAIPQRTDIIRRLNPGDREVFVRVDLERIFAGETPDVFLRPNDQVLVGTNALAPFMAAVRGAFRITYGFGFLYDRNYAYSTNSGGF